MMNKRTYLWQIRGVTHYSYSEKTDFADPKDLDAIYWIVLHLNGETKSTKLKTTYRELLPLMEFFEVKRPELLYDKMFESEFGVASEAWHLQIRRSEDGNYKLPDLTDFYVEVTSSYKQGATLELDPLAAGLLCRSFALVWNGVDVKGDIVRECKNMILTVSKNKVDLRRATASEPENYSSFGGEVFVMNVDGKDLRFILAPIGFNRNVFCCT